MLIAVLNRLSFLIKAFLVYVKLVPGTVIIGSLGSDTLNSIQGLFQEDRTPVPSQIETSRYQESPTNKSLEGADSVCTGSSESEISFTSSDNNGYKTVCSVSDVLGLQIDLQYNESQGQVGYAHNLNSYNLGNRPR